MRIDGLTFAADKRQTRRTRMRGVLSVFVVAWLNLVMQPCAMALGSMEDHDCPHCPPSHEEGRSGHAGHGSHPTGNESASGEMPCAVAATDCSLVDDFNYDGRTVKLELNDPPNDAQVAIGPSAVFGAEPRPAEDLVRHSTRSPPPPASVPLNVFYCVYLK